ncbi:hypothetical protein ACLOJK_004624 [Asimina triloba]
MGRGVARGRERWLVGCWALWRVADSWIVAGPHDGHEKKERRLLSGVMGERGRSAMDAEWSCCCLIWIGSYGSGPSNGRCEEDAQRDRDGLRSCSWRRGP